MFAFSPSARKNVSSGKLTIPMAIVTTAELRIVHESSMAQLDIGKNRSDVASNEARKVLKELLRDLVRKGWNATRFMESGRRMERRRALRALWADKRFADFDPKTGPTVDFFNGMWPPTPV